MGGIRGFGRLINARKLSQPEAVLQRLRRGSATNGELSRIALKYTSVISSLRKDGHNIIAIRMTLPNGRVTNTYNYVLLNEEEL
jgi:hypothetical protein